MRRPGLIPSVLFLVVPLCFTGVDRVSAESITLNPSQDTYISEYFSGPNGTAPDMVIGTQGANVAFKKNRGLIQFDLSSIPVGSVVTSATLRLTSRRNPLTPANSAFQVHRVLRPWNALESTWPLRIEPGENWEEPGGLAGVDYSAAFSASVLVAGLDEYMFASTPALLADVTAWLANPATNHGWLVKTVNESVGFTARRWASGEAASGAPSLEVQFEPSAPPVRINSAAIVGSDFCLRFNARQGKSYIIERRERVDSGSWDLVRTLPPATESGEVVVCDALGTGNRFYRVGEQ